MTLYNIVLHSYHIVYFITYYGIISYDAVQHDVPSGNQTWQWEMDNSDFPIVTFIYRGFSAAMFD